MNVSLTSVMVGRYEHSVPLYLHAHLVAPTASRIELKGCILIRHKNRARCSTVNTCSPMESLWAGLALPTPHATDRWHLLMGPPTTWILIAYYKRMVIPFVAAAFE